MADQWLHIAAANYSLLQARRELNRMKRYLRMLTIAEREYQAWLKTAEEHTREAKGSETP